MLYFIDGTRSRSRAKDQLYNSRARVARGETGVLSLTRLGDLRAMMMMDSRSLAVLHSNATRRFSTNSGIRLRCVRCLCYSGERHTGQKHLRDEAKRSTHTHVVWKFSINACTRRRKNDHGDVNATLSERLMEYVRAAVKQFACEPHRSDYNKYTRTHTHTHDVWVCECVLTRSRHTHTERAAAAAAAAGSPAQYTARDCRRTRPTRTQRMSAQPGVATPSSSSMRDAREIVVVPSCASPNRLPHCARAAHRAPLCCRALRACVLLRAALPLGKFSREKRSQRAGICAHSGGRENVIGALRNIDTGEMCGIAGHFSQNC